MQYLTSIIRDVTNWDHLPHFPFPFLPLDHLSSFPLSYALPPPHACALSFCYVTSLLSCFAFKFRIRIRTQHSRLNTVPDPRFWWPKIKKNIQLKKSIVFWSKIAIYLSLGLQKGHPSWGRSLHFSKENIQHFKTWNFTYAPFSFMSAKLLLLLFICLQFHIHLTVIPLLLILFLHILLLLLLLQILCSFCFSDRFLCFFVLHSNLDSIICLMLLL